MIKLDNQNKLEFVAVALPLLLTFLAVFITRSSVGVYFLMIAGLLVIEFALLKTLHKQFKFINAFLFLLLIMLPFSVFSASEEESKQSEPVVETASSPSKLESGKG